MGILLTTLVTIGKILLVILTVLLILIILLLAVPFRYELSGTKEGGKAEGTVGITWLFHAVRFSIRFSKNGKSPLQRGSDLRIFGISPSEIRKKRARKKHEKQKKNKKKKLDQIKAKDPEKYEELKKEALQRKADREKVRKEKEAEEKKPESKKEEKNSGPVRERKQLKQSHKKRRIGRFIYEKLLKLFRMIFKGTGRIFTFLYELPANLTKLLGTIICKIIRFCSTVQIWIEFLADPRLLEAVKLTGTDLKKLWKKIGPKRLTGEVTYGLGDPSATGKALAAASALFPVYGPDFILHPDFETARLDGDVRITGRIYLGSVLILAAGYLLNKNVRYVIAFIRQRRSPTEENG